LLKLDTIFILQNFKSVRWDTDVTTCHGYQYGKYFITGLNGFITVV